MKIFFNPNSSNIAKTRRQARICALQMLYQWEITKSPLEEVMRNYWEEKSATDATSEFANRLAESVSKNLAQWDSVIEKTLRNWRMERLSMVDRNIVRLAMAEHAVMATPRNVAINEAIEIAKEFGSERSYQFINGVLDALLPKAEAC